MPVPVSAEFWPEAFLARIENEAAKITSSDFAENLIVMQFEKSLRPSDWDALEFRADMDKTGKDRVAHFAQTLDKMKIYEKTKAATHQIAPQVDIQKQLDDFQAAIMAKVDSSQARYEKMETDLVKMFEVLDLGIVDFLNDHSGEASHSGGEPITFDTGEDDDVFDFLEEAF